MKSKLSKDDYQWRIVNALTGREASIYRIHKDTKIPQPTVLRQVAKLEKQGYIKRTGTGKRGSHIYVATLHGILSGYRNGGIDPDRLIDALKPYMGGFETLFDLSAFKAQFLDWLKWIVTSKIVFSIDIPLTDKTLEMPFPAMSFLRPDKKKKREQIILGDFAEYLLQRAFTYHAARCFFLTLHYVSKDKFKSKIFNTELKKIFNLKDKRSRLLKEFDEYFKNYTEYLRMEKKECEKERKIVSQLFK
ncbi:MAG: helix-turn-helix domain-containing protein [Candidatus Thermoplasmatota archaeon]